MCLDLLWKFGCSKGMAAHIHCRSDVPLRQQPCACGCGQQAVTQVLLLESADAWDIAALFAENLPWLPQAACQRHGPAFSRFISCRACLPRRLSLLPIAKALVLVLIDCTSELCWDPCLEGSKFQAMHTVRTAVTAAVEVRKLATDAGLMPVVTFNRDLGNAAAGEAALTQRRPAYAATAESKRSPLMPVW